MSVCACGGSDLDAEYPDGEVDEVELPDPPPPKGALWRRDVHAVVDAGLGRFLQHVDVAPSLDSQGSFQGFRIVELRPPAFWAQVDLQPGDVVTRVNNHPIERDTQAYAAFQKLKTASHLRVSYTRSGRQMLLTYRIVERDSSGSGAKGKSKATPPKPPKAAPAKPPKAAPAKPPKTAPAKPPKTAPAKPPKGVTPKPPPASAK